MPQHGYGQLNFQPSSYQPLTPLLRGEMPPQKWGGLFLHPGCNKSGLGIIEPGSFLLAILVVIGIIFNLIKFLL